MSQEYSEYLLSDEWKAKRKQKLIQGGGKCEVCGTQKRLQIHHLTYERIFREELSDLMILCRKHHEAVEELYADGKLSKKGDTAILRQATIHLASGYKPIKRPAPKNAPTSFWGIDSTSSRSFVVEVLLSNKEYVKILRLGRQKAKRGFKQLSRSAGKLSGKIYTNMLMAYDAFHGIGTYNKFRREVREIAERVGCTVPAQSANQEDCVQIRKRSPQDRLIDEVEKLCGSIRNYTKKGRYDLASDKARRLLDGLVSAHAPTLKLVSYSDGRHEWVTK